MQALVSVLKDLYDFLALGLGLKAVSKKSINVENLSLPYITLESELSNSQVKPVSPKSLYRAITAENELVTSYQAPLKMNLPSRPRLPDKINHEKIGYVFSSVARVYARATVFFDGVIKEIKYATKVEIIGYDGRFMKIRLPNDTVGWVLKEDVTQNQTDIMPLFDNGNIYISDNFETKKLRSYIADTFSAADLYLSLQSEEFVFYKLKQKGYKVSWPQIRPRLAGSWQTIFKGQPGVKISIEPKTGSVIEFVNSDGVGWVGYTEAVMVDETLKISGVGRDVEGKYLEETISKSIWLEWRPVWITVN